MIGAILGGALVFGVSEIFGEVYHSWNRDHEKNVLINAGKKIVDCTEVVEDKAAEVKNKVATKKNYVDACKPKQLASSADSLQDALKALDRQIESINKDKSADILAKEANLVASTVKVCDLIVKEGKLSEEEVKELEAVKAKGETLANQLKNKEISNQSTAKKKIKDYVALVQPFIDKNLEAPIEGSQPGEADNGTAPATFSAEAETIPDFAAQEVTPLTVAEVKEEATKKGKNKNK